MLALFIFVLFGAFLFGIAYGMMLAGEKPSECDCLRGMETEQDAFERWYAEMFQE